MAPAFTFVHGHNYKSPALVSGYQDIRLEARLNCSNLHASGGQGVGDNGSGAADYREGVREAEGLLRVAGMYSSTP